MTDKTVSVSNQPESGLKYFYQKRIRSNAIMYMFLVPVMVYAVLFWYVPMFGLLIGFQNYNPGAGVMGSTWVGFDHFRRFFGSFMLTTLLKNTLFLSLYSFIAGLPFPIILAVSFQYHKRRRFSKFVQTVTYAPNFISVVVIVGMLNIFLSPRTGFINNLLNIFGLDSINFMSERSMFSHIYVWSGIWQGAGWGSVIYTASLSNSDPSLHEAAVVDGASLWKRIIHIDLPVLAPVFVILQILAIGNILNIGFEKIYLMQNPIESV